MSFKMKVAPYMAANKAGQSCNTCTGVLTYPVIAGKKTAFNCRKYDMEELEQEMMMMTEEMDVSRFGLVENKQIGVDGRMFTWQSPIKIKLQSKGTGSYGKKECARDYDTPEFRSYAKKGDVNLLHVDNKICPNEWIGLETLQDMIFVDGDYFAGSNPNNAYTDALILAARMQKTKDLERTDLIGIFGDSDHETAHYDGILAQMNWAYGGAYFHSISFDLNPATGDLQDGHVVSVKVGGKVYAAKFDSLTATDESLAVPTYETAEELVAALAGWVNGLTDNGGAKKYDAVYYNNALIVTEKVTAELVDVRIAVGAEKVTKWHECNTELDHSIVQGFMPIDDRPYLTNWKSDQYTDKNIWCDLPDDIFRLLRDMPKGNTMYNLYIDQHLYERYTDNLGKAENDNGVNRLEARFDNIYFPAGFTHDCTGLWLVAPDMAAFHLINAGDESRLIVRTDEDCDNIFFKFRSLHGVMVKDFRKLGSNLLCSPWASKLVKPQPECEGKIPCLLKECRDNMITNRGECGLVAGFELSAVSRNEALYSLNGEVFNVEYIDGEAQPLPAGANAVYFVSIINRATGVPLALSGTEEYTYTLVSSDGSQWISNESDPLIQFTGLDDLTFTVQQALTVTEENGRICCDTATLSHDESGDFALVGECNEIEPVFNYEIEGVCVNDAVEYRLTVTDETLVDNPVFDAFVEYLVTVEHAAGTDVYNVLPDGELLTITEYTDVFAVTVSARTAAGCDFTDVVADGEINEEDGLATCGVPAELLWSIALNSAITQPAGSTRVGTNASGKTVYYAACSVTAPAPSGIIPWLQLTPEDNAAGNGDVLTRTAPDPVCV